MFRVVITGATGLLGKTILSLFKEDPNWEARGIAYSRATGDIDRCDLRDERSVRRYLSSFEPDVVIHCAQANPKVCESDYSGYKANIRITENLSKVCKELNTWILHMSTNEIFDGKEPPYATNSDSNPSSIYAKSKRDSELVLLKNLPDSGILRVPIVYGKVADPNENEIMRIAHELREGTSLFLDNFEKIYPTSVNYVATVCKELSERRMEHLGLYGTWHCSSPHGFTRYDLAIQIAQKLELPHSHIQESKNEKNPSDARLNCIALQVMGLETKENLKSTIDEIANLISQSCFQMYCIQRKVFLYKDLK